jgi:hypothetical protein
MVLDHQPLSGNGTTGRYRVSIVLVLHEESQSVVPLTCVVRYVTGSYEV